MTYSSADIARLRHPHHATRVTLNAVPQVTVASAEINQSAFTYPLAQLTVDNTSADWETEALAGRMVLIGTAPGLADVTYGVVRKTVTATVLYLDAKSLGDSGYASDIRQPIQNGHYITVLKYRPPWSIYSSIRNDTFYKAFDEAYVDQGLKPAPLVRMGAHRAARVDPDTGVATFTFDASESYGWGGAISGYSWNVDGGTITSGIGTDTITATFPPGFYEVRCTVISATSKVRTGYRYVWANATSGQWAAFSDRYRVNISSDTQDRSGRAITFEFPETLSSELFPGQAFLLTEEATYGGEALDGDSVDSYFGYALSVDTERERTRQGITVRTGGPLVVAKEVHTFSQYLEEIAYPRNWTQVSRALSNPVGAAWYAGAYHAPYIVDAHDLDFDTTLLNLRRKIYTMQGKTLNGQLDDVAKTFAGVAGARSDGTIRLARNANYMTNDERNALDTVWTWGAGDITGTLETAFTYRPEVNTVLGYAFAYDGTGEGIPLASRAPGWSAGQGSGEDTLTITVPAANGQAELNRITGHHFANRARRRANFSLSAVGNKDIAEPCDVDKWHTVTLAASYDPLNAGYSTRILPTRVSRTWRAPNVKALSIEFEVETFGQPGVTVPVNRGGANTWYTNQWNPADSDPYEPKQPDVPQAIKDYIGVVFAANEAGALGRTSTFTDRLVTWERMSYWGRRVVDVSMNRNSAYFSDPDDDLGLWVLEWDSTEDVLGESTLTAWYVPDANRYAYTPALKGTWQVKENMYGNARIIASTEADFVVVAWKDRTGVRVSRSTNGGTSWSTGYVGGSVSDLDNADKDLAIDVRGERVAVIAPDGTQNLDDSYNWFVYHAATKGGAFGVVLNPTDFTPAHGALSIGASSVAIVGMIDPAPPTPPTALENVTFDNGTYDDTGYTSYTVTGSGLNTGVTKFVALSTSTAYSRHTAPDDYTSLAVVCTVDLGADYYFDNMTFETAQGVGTTRTGIEARFRVEVQDASGATLRVYERAVDAPDQSWTLRSHTVTARQLRMNSEPVRYVKVSYIHEYETSTGVGTLDLILDNVDISADLVPYETQRHVYTLNLVTETYTQRNSYQYLPTRTYGIAISRQGEQDVTALVMPESESAPVRLTSANTGAVWAFGGLLPGYTGARRSGDALIAFGYERLGLSPDNGVTIYDRMGNWRAVCGMSGRFVVVTGVL
jgi:hypothetical protein